MRLHILSDLHLEFEPFTPPAVEADVVILAGDVGTGRNGLKWALKTFPDRPVIYVLGNHEFYGQKLQKLIKELQELADGTNIRLLENEQCSIGEVVFLGATLWTDFGLNGNPVVSEVVAQTGMNDYRRIRTLPRYSRLRPADTRRLHMQSRRWLEAQALSLKGQKVVVVTHHAPSRESIPPAFDGDPCNPAFASDLSRFIVESEARLWIHGHIHFSCDYPLGKTRVLANPRGYPTEPRTGFDPGLIVEV
jgi:calcineurin-like phosphoesterase family protein